MELLLILFFLWGLPFLITYRTCKRRARRMAAPMWATFFFGWIAVVFVLSMLDDRSPEKPS